MFESNDAIAENIKDWMPIGKKLDLLCDKLRERILKDCEEEAREKVSKKLMDNRNLVFIFGFPDKISDHW
jgi:hypothetical protein